MKLIQIFFFSQNVDEGAATDIKVTIKGAAPITVAWFKNGVKCKSSRTCTIKFIRGEAKLSLLEASATDDGEYKVEATNKFGEATQVLKVNVICKYNFIICWCLFTLK